MTTGKFLSSRSIRLFAVSIVDVHDGDRLLLRLLRREIGEELHLRIEVLLHRAVKIEMVLGQIGEDGDVPLDPASPLLRDRVRRDFHRRRFAAGVHDLREQLLQLERKWRGANGG